MKKQENRRAEPAAVWLNLMEELLKGGALAAVLTLASALICAVLISTGVLEEG